MSAAYGKVMAVMLIVVVAGWALDRAADPDRIFGAPFWLHALIVLACFIGAAVHIWRGREQ